MIRRIVLACALISATFSVAAQTQAVAPCNAKSDWLTKIYKPVEGWSTAFVGKPLDPSHVTTHFALPLIMPPEGVTATLYSARKKYLEWTEVTVNPCDHSATLKPAYLLIEHVIGYSFHSGTYAYVVSGNCGTLEKGVWISAACDTEVLLVDTTGNGIFDFIHFGTMSPGPPPEWTRK